jgi:hypothetical protein
MTRRSVLYLQQIMTGKPPFRYCPGEPMVILKVISGERPNRPEENDVEEDISDQLWTLMTECWAADATTRPSMGGVLKQLTQMCAAEKPLRLLSIGLCLLNDL